jgi:hypothetical protein
MKKLSLVLVLACAFSSSAFAGGYKSAGCGLGSLVISSDGFLQIFAATTNGTFASQTFGITSGTSNCGGSGGYAKAEVQTEQYVSANLDVLSQEMAQGSGEHIAALATLMGCSEDSTALFSATLQKSYRSIANEGLTTDTMIKSVESSISSQPALRQSCNAV